MGTETGQAPPRIGISPNPRLQPPGKVSESEIRRRFSRFPGQVKPRTDYHPHHRACPVANNCQRPFRLKPGTSEIESQRETQSQAAGVKPVTRR